MKKQTTVKERTRALRNKALRMYDRCESCEEVGKALSVRKMTVAAWVAHRTMGTYE